MVPSESVNKHSSGGEGRGSGRSGGGEGEVGGVVGKREVGGYY